MQWLAMTQTIERPDRLILVARRSAEKRELGYRAQAVVVKVVVAFLLVSQAVFVVTWGSLFGAVFGLRCTSLMGLQLRDEPDQRFGLA